MRGEKRLSMKYQWLLVPILGVTGLLLYFTLTNGHDWGDDFSSYIMQAKSIVDGTPSGFIEKNRFTIEQSSYPIGPVCYPWGFPAMLAPFYAFFGFDIFALKIVGAATYLLFILVLWIGFQKYHENFWNVCLVCLFSLNPSLLSFSDNILSDLPFLLFSTFSVLLIGRVIVERRRIISETWDNVLLGVSIAGAFFIRTNGILLLVVLALAQIIGFVKMYMQGKGQGHTANKLSMRSGTSLVGFLHKGSISVKDIFISGVPYASFFCIVIVWTMILPEGGSSHVSHLKGLSVSLIKKNIWGYIKLPAEFFQGIPKYHLLYGITIPLSLVGIVRRYQRDYHIILYVLLTFLLYIFWPVQQGLRFLFPILPFYCSFLLTGLETLNGDANITQSKLRKSVTVLPVLLIISVFAVRSIIGAYNNSIHNREMLTGPFAKSSRSMFEFIEHNTEPKSVVVFFKPRAMRMITGRQSVMINKVESLEGAGDYLCVHLKMGTYDQVSPDLIKQGSANPIYENSEFRVYRLKDVLNKADVNTPEDSDVVRHQ